MKLTLALALAIALIGCGESSDQHPKGLGGASSGGAGTGGASTGGKAGTGGTSSGGTSAGGGSGGAGGSADGGGAAGMPACPTFANGQSLGTIERAEILEASGIVESRRDPNVLWVNNDSGDSARLFALTKAGADLGANAFVGANADDWEDIAIGPGPLSGEPYLYAGDIGDNPSSRPNVKIYRVLEPGVDPTGGSFDTTLSGVDKITLVYPDGAHNAETLLVDPENGDLYIVTKVDAGASQIFRAAAPLDQGAPITLTEVGKLTFGQAPLEGGVSTTGGDISFTGDAIVVRTYSSAFLWRRPKGMSVAEAFTGEPCKIPVEVEPQGEAIGFTADGSYLTTSEGSNQTIWLYQKN